MGYAGGGVNGALRWKDLALEQLLPVDEEKEEMKRAAEARKMANGTTGPVHHPPQPQPPQAGPDETMNEEDEEEDESSGDITPSDEDDETREDPEDS